MPIADAIEHLVGLQAQATMPPYYGLWSRLSGFDAEELGRLLMERRLVRMTLLRATVHMATPRDAAFLRPLVQPAIERNHNGAFGRRMGGEEFLLVLPGASRERGLITAERVRAAVEAGCEVTVSIGVAAASGEDVAFEPLFRAADRALYDAKRAGRNRVVAEAPALAV